MPAPLPGALRRLLTATRPSKLIDGHFDPNDRIIVETAHDDGGAWLRAAGAIVTYGDRLLGFLGPPERHPKRGTPLPARV